MPAERQPCTHEGCPSELAAGSNIPHGWKLARVEKYNKTNVEIAYYYICPDHELTTTPRQAGLFDGGTGPT